MQFFKRQGAQLIQQIEANLLPSKTPTRRLRVYHTKELLDFCLEIKESAATEPISNAQLADFIDSMFDTGLEKNTIINYIVNHRTLKK